MADTRFSPRNLARMVAFYRGYPILPQAAAELTAPATPAQPMDCLLAVPWYHHLVLIEKVKDLLTRLWYARQVAEEGWSREDLSSAPTSARARRSPTPPPP